MSVGLDNPLASSHDTSAHFLREWRTTMSEPGTRRESPRAGSAMEIEAQCRAALRATPTDVDRLCELAEVRADRGDDTEAVRLLTQVIHYRPQYIRAYHRLALAYYQIGQMT